ncbi:MAG: hypothetical protein M0027_05920 [Candidatus Dormibacteraeota bacterium]|nr:hypothetical protein [Candidatus Dormibacteraeota bacterium]
MPTVYAALAALAFYPVPPLAEHRLLTCACADSVDQGWFLAWTGHALSAGVNPLFTTALNYPSGINVLSNVSMLALGALLAPVSLVLGPVAAFNFAMRLAFMLSGTSMFLVLRWWRISWAPAALGGLVYAFSPYMIGQGTGHLHMAFAPIPPLVLFILERGLSGRWPARRTGLLLGVLAVVEFFISIEIVTSLMVVCAIVVVAGWLVNWHNLRHRLRLVGRILLWSAVVAVPLLIGPILYILKGPEAFTGPAQSVGTLSLYRADLLSAVVPTNLQALGPASWKALGSSFAGGNGSENGEYLGIPMLLCVVAVGAAYWRRRAIRVAWITFAAVFVLTLGPSLILDGHPTAIRLPFDVIAHTPFLQNQIPLRYSLYLQLIAAALAAFGFERGRSRLATLSSTPGIAGALSRWGGRVGILLGSVLVLAPLVPALPYASGATDVPGYFTSKSVDQLPPGTVALAYPYPEFPVDAAMLWQAESDFRFRLVGGYAYRRAADGRAALVPKLMAPILVQAVWADAYGGAGSRGLPPGTSLEDAALALREFCRRYHVGVLLLGSGGRFPGTVRQVAEMAFPGSTRDYAGLEVVTTGGV